MTYVKLSQIILIKALRMNFTNKKIQILLFTFQKGYDYKLRGLLHIQKHFHFILTIDYFLFV